MFQFNILASSAVALLLIDCLAAITVTSPAAGETWNPSQSNTVTWTSVSTDQTSFNIELVNQSANCSGTASSQVITSNVSSTDEKYVISGLQNVKNCTGYQINLVSSTDNAILAQSSPFQISGPSASPNSTSSVSNSTTAVNSTHVGSNNSTSSSPNSSGISQTASKSNHSSGTHSASSKTTVSSMTFISSFMVISAFVSMIH